jgi:hypothetical protein
MYTVELLRLNKLRYIEPQGGQGCKDCGVRKHAALLKKYGGLFAAAEHNEGW